MDLQTSFQVFNEMQEYGACSYTENCHCGYEVKLVNEFNTWIRDTPFTLYTYSRLGELCK